MSIHDRSQIILILKPVGLVAQDALSNEHNSGRLVQIHQTRSTNSFHNIANSSGRECTPYFPPPVATELHLRFSPVPKDLTQGFVFGSDEARCDVVLRDNGSQGISRVHFFIDFNWASGLARLNNLARYGTRISAPCIENGDRCLTHRHSRMLYPTEQTRVTAGTLQFDISFPVALNEQEHSSHLRNWKCLHALWRQAVPSIGELGIQTAPAITKYAVLRNGAHGTYVLHGQISQGSFGRVCLATDNAGNRFAAKEFKKVRKSTHVVNPHLEIGLCQKISHEHIVKFIDVVVDDGGLMLIMEYMPLGNLNNIHLKEALSTKEAKLVIFQTLQALAYLYDEKSITHRDIKPENILVRTRTPELFVKLCDFGLSTEQMYLRTQCGTPYYAAPEIFQGIYSSPVDIWALGVVALQYTEGLPAVVNETKSQNYSALIWNKASSLALDAAKPMRRLMQGMLAWGPQNRLTARECLSDPSVLSSTTDIVHEEGEFLETVSEQSTEIYNPCIPERLLEEPIGVEATRKRKAEAGSEQEKLDSKPPGPCSSSFLHHQRVDKQLLEQPRNPIKVQNVHAISSTVSMLQAALPQDRAGARWTGRKAVRETKPNLPQIRIRAGQIGRNTVGKQRRTYQFSLSTDEDAPKVIQADDHHVRISVDEHDVWMRKQDCMVNANHIVQLRNKDERLKAFRYLLKDVHIGIFPASDRSRIKNSWIHAKDAQTFCKSLGLRAELLQPLIDFGNPIEADDPTPGWGRLRYGGRFLAQD